MSKRLPCDACMAVGGIERIAVTDDGCRHNTVSDAVLAYRAGTASDAVVLDAMRASNEAFMRTMTVEYIARTRA